MSDQAAMSRIPPANLVDAPDDLEAINRLYRDRRWSDGLPIVPPTQARVDRMLAAVPDRARDELVAVLAPAFHAATLERIAINAVMAGCDAAMMRPLVAAVEAVAATEFNLQALQATTNPVAVWIVVNGPQSSALQLNATFNCLGEGSWANATLGRALRLILRNVGGALPGELDRATHGQPGKYSFCCAENEAASPWAPLHVERGFAAGESTVTVIGAEGTMNMNSHSKDADELIRAFGETMVHPPSNEYTHGGEPWIVIGPEHAEILHRAGYGKNDVKAKLWDASRMSAGRMAMRDFERAVQSRRAELGEITRETMLPIAPAPGDIGIVVAGGPGTHSVYVPCFGNSRAVTRAFA
ncbi:MAG TPA: hypothetical protein VMV45_15285 [Casimicrobiaceae bacterium]|nr:hypothetical protein [Casimicrobiaceae bacterium]